MVSGTGEDPMSRRCIRAAVAAATFIALAWLAPQPALGQAADLPRTADGHPDMQGYWDGGPGNASHSIEDGCCDPVHARMQSRGPERLGLPFQLIVDPPDGRIPYQAWAAERRTELLYDMETPTELAHIDPEDRCLLLGAPRSNYRGDLEIRQNDGFNDEPWLDSHGSFYSENLRVVERYTLLDDDTLRYEATLEDPTVFTRPWTLRFDMGRIGRDGEYEFFEEACSEGVTNEHRLAAGRQAVARGERYKEPALTAA